MFKSKKSASVTITLKKLVTLPGSMSSLVALSLSLVCAIGYGLTQIPSRTGYAGQLERQWRDVGLTTPGAGLSLMVSGEIQGQTVTDPGYQLTAKGIYLSRNVSIYQWNESCSVQGCKVLLGWHAHWIDASKFKTQGYSNPKLTLATQQVTSVVLASRAKVGNGYITARLASKLGSISTPYKMSVNDVNLPGWQKSSDGYQNFTGAPMLGAVKTSFGIVVTGIDLTLAAHPNVSGDLDLEKGSSDILFKPGAMSADKLLGMVWWELPRFGWALLALSAALFAAGAYGLWSVREIELQMIRERRRREMNARLNAMRI